MSRVPHTRGSRAQMAANEHKDQVLAALHKLNDLDTQRAAVDKLLAIIKVRRFPRRLYFGTHLYL